MFPRPRATSFLALGLLSVLLALPACRAKITAPSEPPLAVRLGDDAFRMQDYEAAIEDYGVYIDSVERGEYTPLAFYQTALSWYRLERYEQALDVLAELDRRYSNEHWVQVDALRGDAQYKLGRRSAALIAWDEGWRVADAEERPELRRRIVAVLREMDEDELAETREVVGNPDVLALVEHHLAIKQGRPVPPRAPLAEAETEVASPRPPADQPTTSAAVLESQPAPREPVLGDAEVVAGRAETVERQADEVARLSDELDDTGGDVFEAIEDTKQAEGQIRDVDESTASYAPLLKVDIPEPPFVDRPVPEPKKRIRLASPEPQAAAPMAAEPASSEPRAAAEPIAEETVTDEQQAAAVPPGPPVDLEQVDAAAAAASEEEVVAAVPASGAKVACILPLTGDDRAIGERLLRSIRLVFGVGSDQIVFRDSGSDAQVAAELVGELSGESDVLIAIAPAAARDARSLAGSAERAAVPLLLVSATSVPKTRYVMPVPPDSGVSADSFVTEYRERYGSLPGAIDSQVHRAALLAKQALLITPVSRGEVLSRLSSQAPPASDSAS
jgi:tetratricopeptide (TPR) repeat protein